MIHIDKTAIRICIQNMLIYFGICFIITGIWQYYELQTIGKIVEKTRDTYICMILALILSYFVRVKN